jgi:hypothetical protein
VRIEGVMNWLRVVQCCFLLVVFKVQAVFFFLVKCPAAGATDALRLIVQPCNEGD